MELILSTDKKTEIKMSAPKSTISISGAKGTKNHQTLYNLDYENSGHTGFQKELTFDDTPTANSDNPVKSGGIKTELDKKADSDSVYTKSEADTELGKKADADSVYTKTETDAELDKKADTNNVYTISETEQRLAQKLDTDAAYTRAEANTELNKKADKSNGIGGFYGGENASAIQGGAIGDNAKTIMGGSVGRGAVSGNGFSGGANAKVAETSASVWIDAIQLGTGTNNTEKTLQVYDYQLMDANGHIPNDRMPTKADKSASVPRTTVSGYPIALTDALSGESVLDYKIYGNSVQNGTPAADTPVDIQSVGDLVTDTASEHYGKYDIPITLCGDNLFDMETILPEQGWEKQADGSFYVAVNRTVYQKKLWENTEGYTGRLKIDYRVKYLKGSTESSSGTMIAIHYTDGTFENVLITTNEWEANGWIVPDYHIYSNAKKVVDYLFWSYGTGANSTWVKDIIITKNLSAEYEPFSGETKHIYLDEPLRKVGTYADCIDMKAQKVIRNVSVTDTTGTKTIEESLTGTETPTEESAVIPSLTTPVSAAANMTAKTTVAPSKIDLEYYQDINKVIAEIKAAILSNGGNV